MMESLLSATLSSPRPTVDDDTFENAVGDALKVARKFAAVNNDQLRNCRLDLAVVESAALEGLMKARQTFNPRHPSEAAFSTYAHRVILSYIRKRIIPSASEQRFRENHEEVELDKEYRPRGACGQRSACLSYEEVVAAEGGDFADRIQWRQVLAQLPEEMERVLMLRYYEGLSLAQTATEMGPHWSYMQVFRLERQARKMLQQWLAA